MSNPFTAKAKAPRKLKSFGSVKTAGKNGRVNGTKPANPWAKKLKPKSAPTLDDQQFTPDPEVVPEAPLARKKYEKMLKARDAQDFTMDGIRYGTLREHEGGPLGGTYWTMLLTNGDASVIAHNKHGAWMLPLGNDGAFREPQPDMSMMAQRRYLMELQRAKRLRPYAFHNEARSPAAEAARQKEEAEAKEARKRKKS